MLFWKTCTEKREDGLSGDVAAPTACTAGNSVTRASPTACVAEGLGSQGRNPPVPEYAAGTRHGVSLVDVTTRTEAGGFTLLLGIIVTL